MQVETYQKVQYKNIEKSQKENGSFALVIFPSFQYSMHLDWDRDKVLSGSQQY